MANQDSSPNLVRVEEMSLSTPPSSMSTDHRDDQVLQQVQEKLKKQLLDKKNKLDDRIYEQKRQLLRATKDREEVGVQLYDLQCNLSGLHSSLTKTTIALNTATQGHAKAREEMDKVQTHYDVRSKEHKGLTEKTIETRGKLDNITNMLKKLEQLNDKMKGDIAINRHATYTTEEAVIGIEVLKKKQDANIDECQERIKEITDRVAIAMTQLEAQKRESAVANLALKEADIEMGAIHAEKRQLTFQWKTTLVVLIRCDNVVKILRTSIHDQGEVKMSIKVEKKRYQKDIARWIYLNERSKYMLLKIDSSMKETTKYISIVTKKCVKILQHYSKIHVKVEKIEGQIKIIIEEIFKMEAEIKEINKQYTRETSKIHELENKVLTGLLEQVILEEKGAEVTVSNIIELQKLVKEEDTMATRLNHELSVIRCDILDVQVYNHEVNSTLKAVNDNVAAKHNLISKFDAEIKQKGREVEIKTKEIMQLNKKYEQLTTNLSNPSATSPWEAMIHSLKLESNQKINESNESQKRWLSMQTSLVVLQNDVNALSEKAQREAYDQGVLTQRKYRVDAQYNMLAKAIKDLTIGIGQKRNLIIRLNDLIGKNKSLETSLLDMTGNMQIQHYLALKDLAKETMDLQSQFDCLIAEKGHALEHLDELEHHVMLWRYKISFEIETQAAIDPIVGSVELTSLKKSVDRMQFELDGLSIQRKKLINSLESKVDKRKVITSKIEGTSYRRGIQGPTGFEAGLVRAAADLKKAVRDTDKNIVECEKRLIGLEEQKVNLVENVSILNEKLNVALSQQENCKEKLKMAINARSRVFLATAMYQRFAKKHEDFKNNKWKGIVVKKNIDEDLKDAQTKGSNLIIVINALTEQLPIMHQKLDSLVIQIELALKTLK